MIASRCFIRPFEKKLDMACSPSVFLDSVPQITKVLGYLLWFGGVNESCFSSDFELLN